MPLAKGPVAIPPLEPIPAGPRDPVWSGLDVFRLLIIALVILFASVFAMLAVVPGATFRARAFRLTTQPELLIVAQMLAYLLLLGYMYILVTKERRSPRFWKTIHWNWPNRILQCDWACFGLPRIRIRVPEIALYLLGGFFLQLVLTIVGNFLPLPKETPFEALLRRPVTIALIAVFAVTLGPLMEELFFRGFLYPVLARRFGMGAGISVSASGFGLMHAAQYGYSWASVLLIFLVGVVLGVVRARKDSVAAGFLVHAAYNSTIILMLLIATDGFRHLEKLSSQ